MPEGDTVWLVARRLDDALSGQALTRAELRVPRFATADLVGQEVLATVARGKHLLTRFSGGRTLHTHLRMDGMWHLYRPEERWRGGPDHVIRAVLATAERVAVGYRLGEVDLVATEEEDSVVGHLGPDLLDPDADLDEAVRRLRADPPREIGVALLDQRAVAGIGTIYRSETLFVHRVSPFTPVGEVPDLPAVLATARRLLDANKAHASQATTGDPRRGHEHWVVGRRGRPCRRCGTPIRTATQGPAPYDRLTTWCPTCQPRAGGADPA